MVVFTLVGTRLLKKPVSVSFGFEESFVPCAGLWRGTFFSLFIHLCGPSIKPRRLRVSCIFCFLFKSHSGMVSCLCLIQAFFREFYAYLLLLILWTELQDSSLVEENILPRKELPPAFKHFLGAENLDGSCSQTAIVAFSSPEASSLCVLYVRLVDLPSLRGCIKRTFDPNLHRFVFTNRQFGGCWKSRSPPWPELPFFLK